MKHQSTKHTGSILIIEDDSVTRMLLTEYLKKQDRRVYEVSNGEAGLAYCRAKTIDIVLLDIQLPGKDGLSLIQEFKRINPRIGIILISQKGEAIDRIVGLEMGADDYLPKPFELPEVAARIKAIERRDQALNTPQTKRYHFADYCLDIEQRLLIRPDSSTINLPEGEIRILKELSRISGQTAPRDRLLDILRNDGEPASSRSLDVLISRLRNKLEAPNPHKIIITVHGLGYRLSV